MFIINEINYELHDDLSPRAATIVKRARDFLANVDEEGVRLEMLESIAKKCLTVGDDWPTFREAGAVLMLALASTILNNLNEED
jgi:hypothetical protein